MPSSASSRYARTTNSTSPPHSTASYVTGGQQRLNVVTRLAIEGKSKKGWDGASIKMYLKISLPLDNITPGATIALFPEENLKILDSQVHPLDSNSVPYNFSSATSPLLHKAARALNLAARLSTPYVPPSASESMSGSSAGLPSLDGSYTGHILVSGYQVSYVLPKEFPRRDADNRGRRGANMMHFMAAIDIWVPFLSRPPHAPYLLSIPVPRCLSNQIKLRLFPPGPSASSSLASLSSADEDGGWELTSDPHVTRSPSARMSRSQTYSNFADDESSDTSASAGFAEGYGVRGSFPSTERIRIRWASPAKPNQLPEATDGRRRVGVKEVRAEMTCLVIGTRKPSRRSRGAEGVLMQLEYTGTCKGVWFPGVATMLGMDAALEAEDCDITWVPGREPKWTVTGDTGFTGFAVGSPVRTLSRESSEDYPPPVKVQPATPDRQANGDASNTTPTMRNPMPYTSSVSLLRAPLPAQNVADFSFEGSPVSTPTNTVSSLASLPQPSPERKGKRRSSSIGSRYADTDTDVDMDVDVRPPRIPITLHLNMNELLPPSKNVFTFSISGTVLVTPRSPPMTPDSRKSSPVRSHHYLSDSELEPEPIAVPRFRIFYADRETISTMVRNEADDTTVLVYGTSTDRRRDMSLKTRLTKGNQVACGVDVAHIVLRPSALAGYDDLSSEDSEDVSHNRSRSSHGGNASRLRESSMMSSSRLKPPRDGPLMIPSVNVTITPLLGEGTAFTNGYAVHVCLPAPSDADSEWLEFGLALPNSDPSSSMSSDSTIRSIDATSGPPRVEIASASVEGVPVRFQTSAVMKQTASLTGVGLPFEEASGKEWISWVSVHVGRVGGGKVEIIYLVKGKEQEPNPEDEKAKRKGKQKEQDVVPLDILLPSFALPVGRLQVDIQVREDFEIASLRTNLMHRQSAPHGQMLLNYAMDEYFYPRLVLSVIPVAPNESRKLSMSARTWKAMQVSVYFVVVMIVFSLVTDLRRTTAELHAVRQSAANQATVTVSVPVVTNSHGSLGDPTVLTPETVTVTATATATTLTTVVTSQKFSPGHDIPASSEDTIPSGSDDEFTRLTPVDAAYPSADSIISDDQNERDALTPTHQPHSFWNLPVKITKFNLSDSQMAKNAWTTVNVVLNGVGAFWKIFQSVLHYPV
ncbi:uncharacterized protein LAESUDRAFT_730297 [Laetiporus sulphureus 93-53]|uniref:Uncharacterized protein n=1 Tax=Laetiporus sulphureus 93-53 TaxID=1314785 RepID=A0A165C740_9APHY|nr:uncharacterized protein LAESUDRAFT_730297 [Laetiporus sulphureus 93-53]KZT02313.1 hypothetical protein LAESUDRAFT_730297 [Laetiporus sulphureus 93-53]